MTVEEWPSVLKKADLEETFRVHLTLLTEDSSQRYCSLLTTQSSGFRNELEDNCIDI